MNRDEYYAAIYANRSYVEEHKDELRHWGIKGQKWGIRRYQNPDGTLTEEGKRHYGRLTDDMRRKDIAYVYNYHMKNAAIYAQAGDRARRKGNENRARKEMSEALAKVNQPLVKNEEKFKQYAKDDIDAARVGHAAGMPLHVGGLVGGLHLVNAGSVLAGDLVHLSGLVGSWILQDTVANLKMKKAYPNAKQEYEAVKSKYANMPIQDLYNEFDKTFVNSIKKPETYRPEKK